MRTLFAGVRIFVSDHFMRLILILILSAVFGVILLLGVLVFRPPAQEASSGVIRYETKQPLGTAKPLVSNTASSPVYESTSKPQISQTVEVEVMPDSTPEPESLMKPVFYEIRPEKISQLSGEQQWALKQTQEAYISYYNDWMKRYPRDTNSWNVKMKELHEDLIMKLGADGADQLLH